MAAPDVTKMLLLGAVAIFEPVNGYQIRRELLSWGIETWANINPGSIYNGLATLTKQGSVTRHDLMDEGREVAVYQLTDKGRQHHHDLVVDALSTPEIYSSIAFQSAFTQAALITRDEAVDALVLRRTRLVKAGGQFDVAERAKSNVAPPIVIRSMTLWQVQSAAELQWLDETIDLIRAGAFHFVGETSSWTPPDSDPGWEMSAQRERYLRLLRQPG